MLDKSKKKNIDKDKSQVICKVPKLKKVEFDQISFDLESVARQSAGVLATIAGTTVLCTTVVGKHVASDFIPLSVHYIERYSAANRIPGGYKKREGQNSDAEILITRSIDRCLRATIPKEFANEIQVTVQVLSYDGYALEVLAIAAASLSLNLAHVTNKLVAASSVSGESINKSVYKFGSVVKTGHFLQGICDKKIIMLEFIGSKADCSILTSSMSNSIDDLVKMQKVGMDIANNIIKIQKDALKTIDFKFDKQRYQPHTFKPAELTKIHSIIKEYEDEYFKAVKIENQMHRFDGMEQVWQNVMKSLQMGNIDLTQQEVMTHAKHIFETMMKEAFALRMFNSKKRLDDRKFDKVRPIRMRSHFIPNLHGSALFERGDTQALVSVTVASSDNSQSVESLNGMHKENFLLHYNFLPYAVSEIGKVGGVGRREIGHGELARKALLSQLPDNSLQYADYSVRVVSEITSSNGSSSMATVCGASLAMFDAGIPLAGHVAGISIGLIEQPVLKNGPEKNILSRIKASLKLQKSYELLVDITAMEDMLGSMDFKIAGTKNEITALQLDIKNDGISGEIFENALELGVKSMKQILAAMYKAAPQPNIKASNVPKTLKIDSSKVRVLIGKGGSTINSITKEFGVKIDIDKSGKVSIVPDQFAQNAPQVEKAIEKIQEVVK